MTDNDTDNPRKEFDETMWSNEESSSLFSYPIGKKITTSSPNTLSTFLTYSFG